MDIVIILNYNNCKTTRGEKSMTSGKYLEKCIKKREVSISYLTKISGVNRGKLYYVYEGKRKLTEDELFLLIEKAGFSNIETDKLLNLYFEDVYGKTEFSRIKYLENAIQRDNYSCINCNIHSVENDIKGAIENKKQLVNSIIYMFYHDREIISNFSYRDEEIDSVVFDCVLNSKMKLTHIMDLSVDEMSEENLERIFASLKYMYNNCFPVYRYTNIRQMEYNNIFPYYFVGESYAILYNDDNGIFISDTEIVSNIRKNVNKVVDDCILLGLKTNDLMYVKSLYEKGSKQFGSSTITFTFYPCIAKYVDYDFMYSITKNELPEKDMLVNIAFEYYSKIYQNRKFICLTTSKGLQMFSETGNIQEIYDTYVNAADKESRIKVLKNMIVGINNGDLFILDDDKINICPGMEIENHNKKLIINGYDFEKKNFTAVDKFIFSLDDQSIINTFNNFKDYIIHARKVYPKEYSIRFIEGLIVKLEHMNIE